MSEHGVTEIDVDGAAPAPQQQPGPRGQKKEKRPGRFRRFLFSWIVLPGLAAAALVATGAHLGATRPDAWFTRAVRWIAGWL
ncbi:MAG: hypothetical protein PVI30_18165 [Myxococcales bacterium]|jgi:hypothetical protein